MSVPRDDPVPDVEGPRHERDAAGDGERAERRHHGGDAHESRAAAIPVAAPVADVQTLDQDGVRRSVVTQLCRSLEREHAQSMPSVEPIESSRGPGAEAAVGVVEHDQAGRVCPRHRQVRRIICARSGPTLTWLIGTPASASRRST